ncbi:sensor domain-containing diguanylate cyclase [Sphingomonas sp. BN140010]|uniref:Sensor domain-containing diguanylate cyclase n=1 Tax=Sphingomonas arvum TaxID=2992113 RepID=A0ABT3JEU4_9SPHN|nr:sensor domain-containing diguanylate cyclase [Sphingomonas sp. BN140010]MCW3797534.1 sensor domain-containing diguanylate cyclase [Sphingomonas sp. BN140010]
MTAYDPQLHDEAGRLRALQRYNILDSAPERSFDIITALVRDLLNVPMCAVSLIDEGRQWFKSRQGVDAAETPRNMAFCDHTIRSRTLLVVEDAAADPRFAANPLVTGGPGIRSYAGVPLTTPDGYNVGALCVIDRQARTFTDHDLDVLARFAGLIVEQMELRTLAMTDSLTGALSRRGFVEAARRAFCGFVSAQRPAALISFDLDRFKSVNDRFGHGCGNDVLQDVGSLCVRLLRPDDRFGRLGGEEFGILLTGCNLRQAVACAERVRKALENAVHPLCGSVTASFGIAMLERGSDFDDWQMRADRALYAAKEQGRNCVVAFNPTVHETGRQRRRSDISSLIETCARWRTE